MSDERNRADREADFGEEVQAVSETIAQEAHRIVHGERQADYGHPRDNFTHTADLLNAFFGTEFTAADVGLIMVIVKLSRERNAPKRDNLVDIAGYAATVARVHGYDA